MPSGLLVTVLVSSPLVIGATSSLPTDGSALLPTLPQRASDASLRLSTNRHASVYRSSRNDRVNWCPSACPSSQEALRDRLAVSAGKVIGNQTNMSMTAPPACNPCQTPWLFVISIGGRTGSTTVLDMLNAHPIIELAGENHGTMIDTVSRFKKIGAPDYRAISSAMQRGPVDAFDILCHELAEYSALTTPIPTASANRPMGEIVVRGFKDISWTEDAINMLDVLFPCNRKVYSVRTNLTAQALSQAKSDSGAGVTVDLNLLRTVHGMHQSDIVTGQSWRSFWLELRDSGFNEAQFNDLLHWLGEDSCKFTDVIHTNSGGAYAIDGGTRAAASMLNGTCSLSLETATHPIVLGSSSPDLAAPPQAASDLAALTEGLLSSSGSHNFEGDAWQPPRAVTEGFANFAALFDRVVIVCYESTCDGQLDVWPGWLQGKVKVRDGRALNARLGIKNTNDHGFKVTMGHAAAWEELGTAGINSMLILEDDYRPVDGTTNALSEGSSTLDGLRAFVNTEEWQMLRVAYIPHELGEACPSVCRCIPSTASPNVCQVALPPLGKTPEFCEAESMAAYAVHKRMRTALMDFQHGTFSNLTQWVEPIFDATHIGNKSNQSALGHFAVPIDTYFPATLPRTHYITPGFVVQQEKPLQLINMSRFGAMCNEASLGTPLGATVYPLNTSQLTAEAYAAVHDVPGASHAAWVRAWEDRRATQTLGRNARLRQSHVR